MASREVAGVEAGRELDLRRDQDVGVREQVVEASDVGGIVGAGEIEHHAALARVAHRERQATRRCAPGASAGARRATRRLDLDDVGAEVTEQAGGQLAAFDGAVDHAQAGQGQCLFAHRGHLTTPRSPVAHGPRRGGGSVVVVCSRTVSVSVGAGCSGSGAPFTVCWIQLTTSPLL